MCVGCGEKLCSHLMGPILMGWAQTTWKGNPCSHARSATDPGRRPVGCSPCCLTSVTAGGLLIVKSFFSQGALFPTLNSQQSPIPGHSPWREMLVSRWSLCGGEGDWGAQMWGTATVCVSRADGVMDGAAAQWMVRAAHLWPRPDTGPKHCRRNTHAASSDFLNHQAQLPRASVTVLISCTLHLILDQQLRLANPPTSTCFGHSSLIL